MSEKDLQHGASNGCWEFFVTQLQSLYTLPSISQSTLKPTKSSRQCHCRCVPNKNQVLSNASVSCVSEAGRKIGRSRSSISRRFNCDTKIIRREILSRMTLCFCRMFWFYELNSIKAAWMKKCRYFAAENCLLFIVILFCFFLVTLATYFLSSVTV